MNYAEYITPEQAAAFGDSRTLEELQAQASIRNRCIVCGQEAWRYGVGDMCFPCTTGESDASEDYELIYQPRKAKR